MRPSDPVVRRRLAACGLLALAVVVYLPALGNGFVWDDDDHITNNDTLTSTGGLLRIWIEPGATVQYYPLTFTAWWVCHQLWGNAPFGYHLVNVAMHALAAILFWRLLVRLSVPGALFAAALFTVHPVHVMSVAWATELKNTLSASLVLAAALAYLRFAGIGTPRGARPARAYGAALALFGLGVLAKTAVGLLPATLALIVAWKKERPALRDFLPLAPMGLLGVALGGMTVYVERLTGAVGEQFRLEALQRIVVSGKSFWFYLGKLLLPVDLVFIYPRWDVSNPRAVDLLPFAAAAAALAALWAVRSRIGKGPFVGAVHFFLGTSALVLFLVLYMTRYAFVSDHWQYLGSLGMIALLAAGGARLVERLPFAASAGPVLASIVIAVAGMLSWNQCAIYRDAETLWRATLARNPAAWIGHVNLGSIRFAQGRVDEALAHYVEALANDPFRADPGVRSGAARFRSGDRDGGLEAIRRAAVANPIGFEASNGIGVVLASRKRYDEALDFFDAALRRNPRYASALRNRDLALRFRRSTAP